MRVSVAGVGDPDHWQISTKGSEEKRRFYCERHCLKGKARTKTSLLRRYAFFGLPGGVPNHAARGRARGRIQRSGRRGAPPCSPVASKDRRRFESLRSAQRLPGVVSPAAHDDVAIEILPTRRRFP